MKKILIVPNVKVTRLKKEDHVVVQLSTGVLGVIRGFKSTEPTPNGLIEN